MNKPRVMSPGFVFWGNGDAGSFSTQRKAEVIREKQRFFNHREKQRKAEVYF
jgi:hypothetical protein